MELRHLRYFVAVATEQHMRRAAERLHIAQPALTRQIADLEGEIGCRLFDRKARGIALNEPGAQFASEARKILSAVDTAVLNVQRAARGEIGTLRLGFIEPASWAGSFPAAIHLFRTRFPHVSLQVHSMTSRDQLMAISSGDIEAGFCYGFEPFPRVCASIHLHSDRVLLAVPRRYGWRRRTALRLRSLADEPFVWLRRAVAPHYVDALIQAAVSAGISPRIIQEAGDESTLLSLVSAGIGIGFVNSANAVRRPPSVDFVPLRDLTLDLALHLVWKTGSLSPALREFIVLVRQQAARQIIPSESRLPPPAPLP